MPLDLHRAAAGFVLPVMFGFALAIASAPAIAADPVASDMPGTTTHSPRTALTLLDAVDLAMRFNPAVAIASSELTLAGGELLQAQGAFDGALTVNASLQYLQQELSNARKQQLIDQRDTIRTLIDSVREQRSDAETELEFVIAAQADPENIVLPNEDAQAALELYNQLIATAPNEAARAELERLRDAQLSTRREGLEASIAEFDIVDETESERLRKLGDAPEVELSHDVVVGASYRQAYRNGWVGEVFSSISVSGANFRGKKKPAELGGMGALDLYRSRVGVRLLTPFGRGQDIAAAGERAAMTREQAAHALLAHRLRVTLLDTIGAYHALTTAQAVFDVLAESVSRQQRLAELGEALIVADQLPRSERSRVAARDAEAAAQLARARQSLSNARLDLGRSIGAGVDVLPGQLFAADALPELDTVPQLDVAQRSRAVALAQQRRSDYTAALQSAQGRLILAEAARGELRSRHDLLSELSFSGVDEGSRVNQQLQGALAGRWTGPSVKLSYTYERPRHNDSARGVLMQQEALQQQAELQAGALRDDIGRRVESLLDALAAAHDELQQRRAAVTAYQQAVVAERERLQLGSTTLIDLIQTEERLTSSLLGAIGAQAGVTRLALELRFNAGLLAPDQDGQFTISQRDLVRLDAAELLSAD